MPPPEELVAAGCRTPSPKMTAAALAEQFLRANSSAVSVQIGDHVRLAYTHRKDSPLPPRTVKRAREALALAQELYHGVASRLMETAEVPVFTVPEAEAVVELIGYYPRPYGLRRVRVRNHNREGGHVEPTDVELMKQTLMAGGLVIDRGNLFIVPYYVVESDDDRYDALFRGC